MTDYNALRANNWKLPEPVPDPEEDQEPRQPEIDVVWNHYEKGGTKTIAVKVSIRLPRMQDEL